MTFNFFPVVVAVFIINFVTAVAEDDCYKYDDVAPNGKTVRKIYNECGIFDAKTMNTPKDLKCVVEAFQDLNEDGTFHGEHMKSVMKKYANPEYNDKIQALVDEILKEHPESFYSLYPQGMAKICPKDQYYGYPDSY